MFYLGQNISDIAMSPILEKLLESNHNEYFFLNSLSFEYTLMANFTQRDRHEKRLKISLFKVKHFPLLVKHIFDTNFKL